MIVKNLAIIPLLAVTVLVAHKAHAEQAPSTALQSQPAAATLVSTAAATPSAIPSVEPSAALLRHCFQEIDQAIESFENGRADSARSHLSLLLQSCAGVPHLHHNLGTIALLERKFSDAIRYFEKSLALDTRAAMTQQALASVYRYKAAVAYKKALNLTGRDPQMPTTRMQSSGMRNSLDLNALSATSPGDIPETKVSPVIDFELASAIPDEAVRPGRGINPDNPLSPGSVADNALALDEIRFDVSNWWHARLDFDTNGYFGYYYQGVYPSVYTSEQAWRADWIEAAKIRKGELPPWSEVQIMVEPLDSYMLVNLEFNSDQSTGQKPEGQSTHTLLVLKKTDHIWQILKEKTW